MTYWLLKSEPDVFSFADLQAVASEPWNGIRNYQARNFLRQMAVGELCLMYHSNTKPPHIAGLMQICRTAYPDDLQFDPSSKYFDPSSDPHNPRWSMVDVKAIAALPTPISLEALREMPEWEDSLLTRKGSRLSVMPISAEAFAAALKAAGLDASAYPDPSPAS